VKMMLQIKKIKIPRKLKRPRERYNSQRLSIIPQMDSCIWMESTDLWFNGVTWHWKSNNCQHNDYKLTNLIKFHSFTLCSQNFLIHLFFKKWIWATLNLESK
jgi:hypothetical protein